MWPWVSREGIALDEAMLALWLATGLVKCSRCAEYLDPDDQQAAVIDERPVCGDCKE